MNAPQYVVPDDLIFNADQWRVVHLEWESWPAPSGCLQLAEPNTTTVHKYYSTSMSTPARAAFLRPGKPEECYFFQGDQYIRMLVTPGATNDKLLYGPAKIMDQWPSLKQAGFTTIDACLPSPKDDSEVYFFSGDQYCLIKVVPETSNDKIITGPKSIADYWPSLKKAGFTTLEEMFPSPRGDGETYCFKDSNYCRIKFVPGTLDESLMNGPTDIQAGWPSLKKAGFNSIDVAVVNYQDPSQVYCFNGNQYVRIHVVPGTAEDTIVDGPHDVAPRWPALKQAGFY
ncbi:hypothetical protein EYR40_008088 [Pleurotus pulmonarius]|nr:hypothetical protein EYR38_007604 [Pleurotus pulmonarius]KAF4597626.1 hypothetical protein EYR40_008088 [Pleurotus pulmonarius]